MLELYPYVKWTHVAAVIASGVLFAVRGVAVLAGSHWAMHAVLRHLSYGIDIVLLSAALMLVSLLHQYPFVHAWLTVKVLLLLVYILLGSLALKRARTRQTRACCFVAALLLYAFIASVARAHHPLGIFVG